MIISRIYRGLTFDYVRASSDEQVCYVLLPEGLKEDLRRWIEDASAQYNVSIVVVTGMDWNDDLTPWRAEGVMRKAKPFGGHGGMFLRALRDDYIPNIEAIMGLKDPRRSLVGVSLSGLFALWSCFVCDTFASVASISGSLWYDGFAQWACCQSLKDSVSRIYISLGDREKSSKDARMCTVESASTRIVESLQGSEEVEVIYVLERDTTHFSPIVPRLTKAFEALY